MDGNDDATGANGTDRDQPHLVITWAGPGQAAMTVTAPGITDAQLFAAAFLLDLMAREVRAGAIAQQQLGAILPEPAEFLASLRRAGRV